MKRINSRCNRGMTATSLVLIALLNTPGFAQPASTNYPNNIVVLDGMVKSRPNDENARYYRALALQKGGNYQKAKADYQWIVTHSKNPTLLQYANTGLKNLAPTTGKQQQGSAISQAQTAQRPQGMSLMKYINQQAKELKAHPQQFKIDIPPTRPLPTQPQP